LVYCIKCGAKNEEDARYCIKCGTDLKVSQEKGFEKRAEEWGERFGKRAEEWGEQFGKRAEEDCFGLPHGGLIIGLILGIIIIVAGLSLLAGIVLWFFWPIILIIFGILIIVGVLYSLSRR
jgi:uncharacterized membrane protein YvbJ